MASTLLVPELRELLAAGDTEALRQFCERGQRAVVADLLSGLDPEEILQVLRAAELPARAEVFSQFELEPDRRLPDGR